MDALLGLLHLLRDLNIIREMLAAPLVVHVVIWSSAVTLTVIVTWLRRRNKFKNVPNGVGAESDNPTEKET